MTNEPTATAQGDPWEAEWKSRAAEYPQDQASRFELHEGTESSQDDDRPKDLPFDLEERTAKFGEAIIRFVKKMPLNATTSRIIDQLVGCGTSIGGNYCEADEAVFKKEFIIKIGTCKKEAKETKFFLRM